MIPKRFSLDAMETGMGGVEMYSVPVEFTVCERCGCVVAVALLDRHPHDTTVKMTTPREPLVKLTEPKPPQDEDELNRWREVALSKWLHYRDNVWPAPAPRHDVARSFHAHQLAKMIPYLLGRPDLALDDTSPEAIAASYGPHSGIMPDVEPKPERIVKPTRTGEGI